MTIKQKKAFLSAIFLGLGLVSCSKETEVKYQEDNYQPSQLMMEKSDKSLTALEDLSTLDYSLSLVIDNNKVEPNNEIKNLVLSVSCRAQSGNLTPTHISNWPNPTKIKVLDILPTDTLLQRKNEPIFCDISYTTTSRINSTNTGKKNQIKIINTDTFSNLSQDHLFSQKSIRWTHFRDQAIVPIANATSTIACDDIYVNLTDLDINTSLSNIVSQEAILAAEPKSPVQNCRALFRTETTVVLSPVFQLEIPIVSPTFEYKFSKRSPRNPTIDESQSINYTITNSNSFPLTIIVGLKGKTIRYRAVYAIEHTKARFGNLNELPVIWFLNGQALAPDLYDKEIVLPAFSQTRLDAVTVGSKTNLIGTAKDVLSRGSFLGLNLGVNDPVTMHFKKIDGSFEAVLSVYVGTTYATMHAILQAWDFEVDHLVHGLFHDRQTFIDQIVYGNDTNGWY